MPMVNLSGMPQASKAADALTAPRTSGTYNGTASSVTTTAANIALTVPASGAYFTFQARGADVYVRFAAAGSAAATTTGNASTGYLIANGTTQHFWVTPDASVVDANASASGSLFWWQSSPSAETT